MKKIKLQVGDPILVIGTAFFEKTEVKSIEASIAKLSNGIKISTRTLKPKNSKCEIELFNEDKYQNLLAESELPSMVIKLQELVTSKSYDKSSVLSYHKKLSKLINTMSLCGNGN